jgi:hypothetical protein
VVVVSDGEGDIDGVARQKRGLVQAFGHVPAQGVENGPQFLVLSFQFLGRRLQL